MHEAAEVTASVGDGLDQSLKVKRSRESRRGRTAVTLDNVHLGAPQLPVLGNVGEGRDKAPTSNKRPSKCPPMSGWTRVEPEAVKVPADVGADSINP